MPKKPIKVTGDIANGSNPDNLWKTVLIKDGSEVKTSELYFTTKPKAQEMADYLNSILSSALRSYEYYAVRKHNPFTYVR